MTSAPYFHSVCSTDLRLSILSILETPMPSAPVSVLQIMGNLPPTSFTADSMFSSLATKAVRGCGNSCFLRAIAVSNLLAQSSMPPRSLTMNTPLFCRIVMMATPISLFITPPRTIATVLEGLTTASLPSPS